MAEQTINPVSPVNRSADSIKKKPSDGAHKRRRQRKPPTRPKTDNKHIIDTYA